tara:strand:- start:422 stop:691 length:270 start_codon:yes stop_codon:yes gene_type:complete
MGYRESFSYTETTSGYKNWETFNVAVWLGNDYPLYRVASGYSKYASPYLSLRADLKESFKFTDTRDGVSLWDRKLDIKALDECLKEMAE